jgi:hypothetical protein
VTTALCVFLAILGVLVLAARAGIGPRSAYATLAGILVGSAGAILLVAAPGGPGSSEALSSRQAGRLSDAAWLYLAATLILASVASALAAVVWRPRRRRR